MCELNFDALMENLLYVLKESQLKIGYTDNAASLNYPAGSLCRLLGRQMDDRELEAALAEFCRRAEERLGKIAVSLYDGQYCLTVPREGVRYVHDCVEESGFLSELIAAIRAHRVHSIEDVLEIFSRYSDHVLCEEVQGDGYDHVVYFADGDPDRFVYLFETELGHVSYHRMTRADYEAEMIE